MMTTAASAPRAAAAKSLRAGLVGGGAQAVYQDKTAMLFSGTVVTVGRARAVVSACGVKTAIGKIHTAMTQTSEEMTPLKKKLDEFGTFLAKARPTK